MEELKKKISFAIKNNDSRAMKNIALELEEILLEESKFPDEYFNLLCKLFEDENFCITLGAEQFVWIIYNDFEKLSDSQSEILFKMFIGDFGRFKNKTLIHSLADFIARKYPPKLVLQGLHKAFRRGNELDCYAALVASEILAINKKTTYKEKNMAANLIDQITRSCQKITVITGV